MYERLRSIESEEGVEIGSAEEEEDGSDKSQDASGNSAGEDPLRRDDTRAVNLISAQFRLKMSPAYLAFFVSSAICPEASKPVSVPAANKLQVESRVRLSVAYPIFDLQRENPVPSGRCSSAVV